MSLQWVFNNDLKQGLNFSGTYQSVTVFTLNGNLYCLHSVRNTTSPILNKLKFNPATLIWETTTDLGAITPVSQASGAYFEIDTDKYLIVQDHNGNIAGYKWGVSGFESFPDIITDIITSPYGCPTTFYLDGQLCFTMLGNYPKGFVRSGSAWVRDDTILNGISGIMASSKLPRGRAFIYNGTLSMLLFNAYTNGHFIQHNGTQWVDVPEYANGFSLYTGGNYPAPFYLDGNLHTLVGQNGPVYAMTFEYQPTAKISSTVVERTLDYKLKISVTLTAEPDAQDVINIYYSDVLENLVSAENIQAHTKTGLVLECILTVPDCSDYFIEVQQTYNETLIDSDALSGLFTYVDQKATTIINVTDANKHITLSSPVHSKNHSLIHYNGYVYGSSRDRNPSTIFKVKQDDYSVLLQKKIWYYSNSQSEDVDRLDNIVFCSGFLWGLAWVQNITYNHVLIRIDPSTLDYMFFQLFFNNTDDVDFNQPIGTDGTYLYVPADINVYKLDTSLLIGTPASYGYTGDGRVSIPENTILGSTAMQNHNPSIKAYTHSILVDAQYIYLGNTTPASGGTGLYEDGTSFLHLQKVDKQTMQTVGDVIIPRSTDDMCMNDDYVFIVPEFPVNANSNNYKNWGLFAVNKQTLEIKALPGLHSDFATPNEVERAGFGTYYINGFVAVQLSFSKKTFIVDISDVLNWNINYPVGGVTKAIYSFQINGVSLSFAPNELALDSNGYVHISTWEENTRVLKFPISEFSDIVASYNALSLSSDSAAAILETLNEKYGCSIRCVQDAPGVADGVTGTATDQDGNEYDTIVINEKRWFVQNLKVTTYTDGTPIANKTVDAEWAADEDGAFSSYENK